MNPQNPIEDLRYIRSPSNEDILARKVERKPDGPPKSKRNYKDVEGKPTGNVQKRKSLDDDDLAEVSIYDISRKRSLEKTPVSPPPEHVDIEVEVEEDVEDLPIQPVADFKPKTPVSKDRDEDDKPSQQQPSSPPQSVSTSQPPPPVVPVADAAQALAAVTPTPVIPIQNTNTTTPVTKTQRVDLQEIIDQITDKIYTLKVTGKTDMTVEFKYPPGHIFEGMKCTVTAYDSAAKEFNVSFTNLTQEGQKFLEMGDHLSGLRQILDSRGVIVHMILPTTQTATPIMAEQKQPTKEDQNEAKYGRPQQQNPQQNT